MKKIRDLIVMRKMTPYDTFKSLSRQNSTDSMDTPGHEEVVLQPKSYKRRWLILFIFIFLSTMNNLTQYSFSPVSDITIKYYGITPLLLDSLAIVYMVSGFTTRFLGMWVIDNKGLGYGVFIAAILNCVGGWIRFWPGNRADGFWWLFAGQSICAIAQSFIDIVGPKLAANWFLPKERSTATALASGPIFAAVLIAYATSPRFVKQGSDIPRYLLIVAGLSSASAVLVFCFFRGSPPTPPSYSAAVEKMKSWDAIKSLAKLKNFLLMFLVFSIILGCAVAFSVLMDQIVAPAHYTNNEAGTITSVWIAAAILGGALGGPIVDYTHAYKPFIMISLMVITLAVAVFNVVLQYTAKNMYIICTVAGFIGLGAAGVPAILEATVETTYPVPEATAMGFLFLGLNITGIVFTLALSKLKDPKTGSYFMPLWITVGLGVVAIVCCAFFKNDYRRLAFEKAVKDGKSINSNVKQPLLSDYPIQDNQDNQDDYDA